MKIMIKLQTQVLFNLIGERVCRLLHIDSLKSLHHIEIHLTCHVKCLFIYPNV